MNTIGKCTLGLLVICLFLANQQQLVSGDTDLNQAGQQFGAAFKSLGAYFVKQYNKVGDFFATTRDELVKKVKDTADFLAQAKSNMAELKKEAVDKKDQALQDALNKVDTWKAQVDATQQKVASVTDATAQQLMNEWKTQSQDMYNGGLDKIIAAAQSAKNGATGTLAAANTFLLSSALFVFVVKFFLQ